jgi:glycosyltransferase involved in cell wall biosynthesis
MKILCIIDSLGSGGAQRQMVNLACGLKGKGHVVELFLYFPELRFFRPEIDAAAIPVHVVSKGKGFSSKVIWRLVQLYRMGKYDRVISFLDGPNLYAEIAHVITLSKEILIISERRSFKMEIPSLRLLLLRLCHSFADCVVANSYAHANWLGKRPWLKHKTYTIYNGYSLSIEPDGQVLHGVTSEIKLLVIGRIDTGKNGLRLLQGVMRFYEKHGDCPIVLWAGRQDPSTASLQERQQIEQLLTKHPDIASHWQFLGERRDIPDLLQHSDALIHVSLYEGLPNAVCEAFVAARPVIVSNVCDHPVLVEEGVRGFLCDPHSPESICEAIERFVTLTPEERQQMGRNARVYAEQYLSIDRMVSDYEALLDAR